MLGFRLDGELLGAGADRFLERATVPFIREVVAVAGRSLADATVNPARVGFSSKFSYETFQFCDPVSKLGDFVDVWIIANRGIIDFVNAETGQAKLDTPRTWTLPVTLPLGSMAVEAGLGGAVTPALPVVDVEIKLEVDHLPVKLDESVWLAVH
jgi:hypothetical protein